MAALRFLLVVAIVLIVAVPGVTDASATRTVGVLTVTRYPAYSSVSIIIGHNISSNVTDLGTWSPLCQFNKTPGHERQIRHHCTTDNKMLRLEWDNPTPQDGQGSYVCGNGGFQSLINCSASYTTEARNAGAPVSGNPFLLALLPCLALWLALSH